MALAETLLQKGLPASLMAERSVLGAILLDGVSYHQAAEVLRADDFHLDSHRKIFRALQELAGVGRVLDYVTVGEVLERAGELDAVGGYPYLLSLTDGLPRSLNIESYAHIVKDHALLRRLISAANQILGDCLSGAEESRAVLDRAQQSIFDIAQERVQEGLTSVRELAGPLLQKIENQRGQDITGLQTGYKQFDGLTAGLQPGELIIIAARPSMGKTSFAMNIAENAALRGGKKVAVFSLEMSKVQLVLRMLCATAHVNAHEMRKGFLNRDDLEKLTDAAAQLAEAPIYLDDTSGIDLSTLRAKCRRLQLEKGLDLVVIDYLQLMGNDSSARRSENRNQEISAISRGLKGLAKELKAPVVALSQLSRASEGRKGEHRPILSDLRESGAIEQDADLVAFIYRDEYYHKDNPENKGIAEIIIAKQRNGPIGTIELAFVSDYTRFENLQRE